MHDRSKQVPRRLSALSMPEIAAAHPPEDLLQPALLKRGTQLGADKISRGDFLTLSDSSSLEVLRLHSSRGRDTLYAIHWFNEHHRPPEFVMSPLSPLASQVVAHIRAIGRYQAIHCDRKQLLVRVGDLLRGPALGAGSASATGEVIDLRRDSELGEVTMTFLIVEVGRPPYLKVRRNPLLASPNPVRSLFRPRDGIRRSSADLGRILLGETRQSPP